MKAGEILSLPQTLIQSSHKFGGNMCCMSGLRSPCMVLINDLIFSEFEIQYWCTPTPTLYQHIYYD